MITKATLKSWARHNVHHDNARRWRADGYGLDLPRTLRAMLGPMARSLATDVVNNHVRPFGAME